MAKVSEGVRDESVGYFTIKNASPEAVQHVLGVSEADLDGRSQWVWCRLPNGDLMLGVFPQGDTYLDHEREYP